MDSGDVLARLARYWVERIHYYRGTRVAIKHPRTEKSSSKWSRWKEQHVLDAVVSLKTWRGRDTPRTRAGGRRDRQLADWGQGREGHVHTLKL